MTVNNYPYYYTFVSLFQLIHCFFLFRYQFVIKRLVVRTIDNIYAYHGYVSVLLTEIDSHLNCVEDIGWFSHDAEFWLTSDHRKAVLQVTQPRVKTKSFSFPCKIVIYKLKKK